MDVKFTMNTYYTVSLGDNIIIKSRGKRWFILYCYYTVQYKKNVDLACSAFFQNNFHLLLYNI